MTKKTKKKVFIGFLDVVGPQKFRRSLKWPRGFMALKHKLALKDGFLL